MYVVHFARVYLIIAHELMHKLQGILHEISNKGYGCHSNGECQTKYQVEIILLGKLRKRDRQL